MRKEFFKILISLIFVANLGFAEYVTERGKIYYNEDYHKTLVVKRIDDEKSEKYLTKSPDLKSFKILNENFAKDKDTIYYKEYDILEADINSFEILDEDTGKDKNYIYLYGETVRYENSGEPVDMKKVTFYENSKSKMYYFRNKNDIYVMEGIYAEKVDNVDKRTFEDLGGGFGRDKNWIYSGKMKLRNIDRESFENIGDGYIKDKNGIYRDAEVIFYDSDDSYNISRLENVDKESFENIGEGYSKDKNNIYYNNEKFKNIDVKTFQLIGNGFSKDRNNVYFEKNKIEGAEAKTFQIVDNFFEKDRSNIFYKEHKLKNISPIEFQTLYMSKNANVAYAIFFKNKDGVFKLLIEDPFDLTKNKVVKLNVDKDSVKILSKNYYKDRNNVYCNDKVLKGADVKTFELVGNDKDEAMDEFIDALENIFDASSSLEKSNETKKSSITAQDKNHKYEYCNIIK